MTEEKKALDPRELLAARREEETLVKELEKDQAGERAEAEERAELVADGVVLPVSPADAPETDRSDRPDSEEEIDFRDAETIDEDHGRGLV